MGQRQSRFVVGLTGGIGSGKSTVAACLEQRGAHVVDADAISHSLTQPRGPAIASIAQNFPGTVVDDTLDRARLREIVFADPAQRKRLEAILHPMVREATQAAMTSPAATAAPYVLLVVPLLFESPDYGNRIDCAVLIDLDENAQVERVTQTRPVDATTVRRIIAAQMPRAERRQRAQFIVNNAGSRAALEPQIDRLHAVFAANARHKAALSRPSPLAAA